MSDTETRMTRVRGEFPDEERTTRAVDDLVGRGVPMDAITVTVKDASGAPRREVPVEGEGGAKHGAVIGAVAGSIGGFLVALLLVGASSGWSAVLTWFGLLWGLSGALIGIVAGVSSGALLKFGEWGKEEELRKEGVESGSAVVEVRSNELADLAREVLENAGAARITTT